ncbi:MAG: hypothetical protein LC687_04770 [Actinobacteria bacterium]|nr:hypothetical protein [Actinomycetota bacterium]MCA1807147.1 hypothetical protein [Actinomycetota bacterium]
MDIKNAVPRNWNGTESSYRYEDFSASQISPNDPFRKMFTVGLSPLMYYSAREFEKLLSQIGPYISEVFSSPPVTDTRYHARPTLNEAFGAEGATQDFIDKLALLKSHNISFKLCLNTMRAGAVKPIADTIREFIDTTGTSPDRIVTLDNYVDDIKSKYPDIPLSASVNNAITTFEEVDKCVGRFDYVCMGGRALRRKDLFRYIKSKNMKVEYMLGNGCVWFCNHCGFKSDPSNATISCNHPNSINKIVDSGAVSAEYMFAAASILPDEFHDHIVAEGLADIYKIPSRATNVHHLRESVISYVKGEVPSPITEMELQLWVGLLYIHAPYFQRILHNFDKVLEYKKEIWDQGYPSPLHLIRETLQEQ